MMFRGSGQSSSAAAAAVKNDESHIRDSVSGQNAIDQISVTSLRLIPYQQALNFPTRQSSFSAGTNIATKIGTESGLFKPNKVKPQRAATKRTCNCSRSQCLKLYCDCFAHGEFCLDCNCKDCHNNLEHDYDRSAAIRSCLERNSSAFKPKIGVTISKKDGRGSDMERLHQKGCNCKKSNCLKNYCECFEAKVPCTSRCKCLTCQNTEKEYEKKDKHTKTMVKGLAEMVEVASADAVRAHSSRRRMEVEAGGAGDGLAGTEIVKPAEYKIKGELNDPSMASIGRQQTAFAPAVDTTMVQNILFGGFNFDEPGGGKLAPPADINPKTQPWYYLTDEVIDATTQCLLAQAHELEQQRQESVMEFEDKLEANIVREFGRCLKSIIDSAKICQQVPQVPTPMNSPKKSLGFYHL